METGAGTGRGTGARAEDAAGGEGPQDGTRRPYDVVLFGATGFVGGLTAEYLAEHAPAECRWALAGRNRTGLAALRERLAARWPHCAELPLVVADADDPDSLRALAESARVVATTVGPYVWYGEGLVAACAEAGTDCVDLTGEAEFVDRMYVRHDARARETGARIVHACGFDSVPHDLGAYFTVQQLPEGVPLRVDGFVRVGAAFSGGTFASALTALGRGRRRPGRGPRAAAARTEAGGAAGPRAAGQPPVQPGDGHLGPAAADARPAGGGPLGRRPRPVRAGLPLPPLRLREDAPDGPGRHGGRRRGRGGCSTPFGTAMADGALPAGPGPVGGAPGP